MERQGIDISTWQGSNVNFNSLKSAGIEFVILRAGYGRYISQKDKQFENNYSKAKAAGMPVGAYWYSYATSVANAKAEAQTCLTAIKGKTFEYPIYFDLEDPSQSGLSNSVRSDMVVAFCEELEKAGYYAGLYANLSWLNSKLDRNKIAPYTIWLAQWTSKPTYKHDIGMWQYTSSGKVSGVSGNVDRNKCYVDFPTAIKEAGLNGYSKSSGSSSPETSTEKKPVTSSVVDDVIAGKYGDGTDRRNKLEAEGYDYEEVQAAVNEKLGASTTKKKVTDAVVSAVIRGEYGNGSERRKNLESKGYDYEEVQEAVNKKMSSSSSSLKVGNKVKIKSGAKWATGQKVPTWVTQKTLYVRSTPDNGKCQVSTLQSGAITGVAYTKDLKKI